MASESHTTNSISPTSSVSHCGKQSCGSMKFLYGSGCGSGSCYFRQWPSRRQQKFFLLITYFLKVHLHHFSKIKCHKEVKKRNQWRYFCSTTEGSGSISLTNGSGFGSGRTRNIWILRIRIRIRIHNTGEKGSDALRTLKKEVNIVLNTRFFAWMYSCWARTPPPAASGPSQRHTTRTQSPSWWDHTKIILYTMV